jgi:nitrile hydratase
MHPHDRTPITAENAPGYYEILETALRELLVEKHIVGPAEIRRQIEVLDSRTPALGAKVVARA